MVPDMKLLVHSSCAVCSTAAAAQKKSAGALARVAGSVLDLLAAFAVAPFILVPQEPSTVDRGVCGRHALHGSRGSDWCMPASGGVAVLVRFHGAASRLRGCVLVTQEHSRIANQLLKPHRRRHLPRSIFRAPQPLHTTPMQATRSTLSTLLSGWSTQSRCGLRLMGCMLY